MRSYTSSTTNFRRVPKPPPKPESSESSSSCDEDSDSHSSESSDSIQLTKNSNEKHDSILQKVIKKFEKTSIK